MGLGRRNDQGPSKTETNPYILSHTSALPVSGVWCFQRITVFAVFVLCCTVVISV